MHHFRYRSLFSSILILIFISITFTSTPSTKAAPEDQRSRIGDTVSAIAPIRQPLIESSTTPERLPVLVPNVESGRTPEIDRRKETGWNERRSILEKRRELMGGEGEETAIPQESSLSMSSLAAPTASGLGPNLIPNFDLETINSSGLPASWYKGGYGVNTRAFTYPASGVGGSKGAEVRITSYSSGDAKWYSAEVPVSSGKAYRFSNSLKSTVPSYITLRYKKTDGSYAYADILSVGAKTDMTEIETEFTVPQNVVSLSIFHLIKSVGALTTDEYYLQEVLDTSGGDGNLMPNPGFETEGSGGPSMWYKGGYGVNTRAFTYPASGVGGSKGAEVRITSYSSGDAKWYHDPITVNSGGLYTFGDAYNSNTNSVITAQFELSNGSMVYLDLARLPSSGGVWEDAVVDFVAPQGAKRVRIFHLIKTVGSLTIDSVSLYEKVTGSQGVFDAGAVSMSFDDGWRAHHDIAMKKLNAVGLKGTFYVISRQLTENGFVGFMTHDQVKAIRTSGHEIGAHTQTHKPLTSLSAMQQQIEIEGSKKDLENMGVGPITTFAYPFGDYNASVLALVKQTPYDAARSTINGTVTLSSDIYQLPRFSVESNTTLANVRNAVDTALANKQWLILVFHRIDTSGERYSVTPTNFNAIVDYIDSKNIFVPTIAEGINAL